MYKLIHRTKMEVMNSICDLTISLGADELSRNGRLIELAKLKGIKFYSNLTEYEQAIYSVVEIVYQLMCDEFGHSTFYADIDITIEVNDKTKYEYNFNRKGIRSLR